MQQLEAEKNTAVIKVTAELEKMKKDSEALTKKYVKMKSLYESYQSANKRYIKGNEQELDDGFLRLAPTIEIDLQCMSVKQLRSLFNQNKRLIEDCLQRYSGRYTTKTNAALYKLMTIALVQYKLR